MRRFSLYTTVLLCCILAALLASFMWLCASRRAICTFQREAFSSAPAVSSKDAIVVLTKGYGSLEGYAQLIQRNTSINNMFYSQLQNKERMDVLIYHEGNVPVEHQQWIQRATPTMPLVFKNVEFRQNKGTAAPGVCHATELSERFTMGYKNMCRFWSVGLLEHMRDYDYIIRIDEDCVLHKMDPTVLDKYRDNGVMFSSPKWIGEDTADVTVGMHDFFRRYKVDLQREVQNPYTNFMVVNIPYFAARVDVQTCLADILAIFIDDQSLLLEDKEIAYHHGSHGTSVNI